MTDKPLKLIDHPEFRWAFLAALHDAVMVQAASTSLPSGRKCHCCGAELLPTALVYCQEHAEQVIRKFFPDGLEFTPDKGRQILEALLRTGAEQGSQIRDVDNLANELDEIIKKYREHRERQ